MAIRPFGNISEQLAGLVQQKFSPQTSLIEARLREMQQNEVRQGLLRDYLSTADLSKISSSDLLGKIMSITGDARLAPNYASTKLAEEKILAQKQNKLAVAKALQQYSDPQSLGGARVTFEEIAQSGLDPEGVNTLSSVARGQAGAEGLDLEKARLEQRKLEFATAQSGKSEKDSLNQAIDDTRLTLEQLTRTEKQRDLNQAEKTRKAKLETRLGRLLDEQAKRLKGNLTPNPVVEKLKGMLQNKEIAEPRYQSLIKAALQRGMISEDEAVEALL